MIILGSVCLFIESRNHLDEIEWFCSQIQFLTSGGGSKAWKGDVDKSGGYGVKFYYDGQGFMSVELDQMNAKVVYYDVFGNVLHVVNLSNGVKYAM